MTSKTPSKAKKTYFYCYEVFRNGILASKGSGFVNVFSKSTPEEVRDGVMNDLIKDKKHSSSDEVLLVAFNTL